MYSTAKVRRTMRCARDRTKRSFIGAGRDGAERSRAEQSGILGGWHVTCLQYMRSCVGPKEFQAFSQATLRRQSLRCDSHPRCTDLTTKISAIKMSRGIMYPASHVHSSDLSGWQPDIQLHPSVPDSCEDQTSVPSWSSVSTMTNFIHLPNEILHNVFKHVDPVDLAQLSRSCKFLNGNIRSDGHLFKAVYCYMLVSRPISTASEHIHIQHTHFCVYGYSRWIREQEANDFTTR